MRSERSDWLAMGTSRSSRSMVDLATSTGIGSLVIDPCDFVIGDTDTNVLTLLWYWVGRKINRCRRSKISVWLFGCNLSLGLLSSLQQSE